jgi:hypothetical protein
VNLLRELPRRPAWAVAVACLLWTRDARSSGVVGQPVTLDVVLQRATLVVVGQSLGTRQVHVKIPSGPKPLEFDVEQVGVRVEEVLADRGGHGVRRGAVLWITDSSSHAYLAQGDVARVAWIVMEEYAPAKRVAFEQPGTRVVAFVETSRERVARGAQAAGLPEGFWQVTGRAFDAASRRRDVVRLLRAAAKDAPRR